MWGEDTSPNNAMKIGLDEDYTLVAGYRRDFGADGSLLPGQTPQRETNELLHVEIAGFVIADIMGFDLGFSLGRKFGQGKSIGDSLIATLLGGSVVNPTNLSLLVRDFILVCSGFANCFNSNPLTQTGSDTAFTDCNPSIAGNQAWTRAASNRL